MTNNPPNEDAPILPGITLEEVDDESGTFKPGPPPEDDDYKPDKRDKGAEEREMKVESVLLGAMATHKQDRMATTMQNLLALAKTSADLSEDVGDLLTQNSFFEAADETQEISNVDYVRQQEQKKLVIKGIVAKLMQKLAEANVARKAERHLGE